MTLTLRATTRQDFVRLYAAVRDAHPHGDALTPAGELDQSAGTRYYLTGDRRSGFAVRTDGYAFGLFSVARGRGDALVAAAVERGATALDCFDGYLPALYARHGFVITRREANWTPGGPDVVWMSREA